jgi:hypothetical protein
VAYATSVELAAVLGYTPDNAAALLDRASRDIDRVLLTATYDTADAGVIVALRDATIEQVTYQLTIGNTDGIRHGMQPGVPSGTSAGSVDLSRGRSVGGSTQDLPLIGEQAWAILQAAELTGQGPIPV